MKSDSNKTVDNNAKTSKFSMTNEDNAGKKGSNEKDDDKEVNNKEISDTKNATNQQDEKSKPQKIVIPDLKKLSKSDALKSLKKYSLNYQIKEKYSDKIKKGIVISQSPKSGTEIEEGSDINIVISKGLEKVRVPSVIGISLEKAKLKLKNNHLKYKIKKEYSSNIAKGKVIRQSDEKGSNVKKNKVITLVVSKGKKPIPVVHTPTPSYVGNSGSNASNSSNSSSSGGKSSGGGNTSNNSKGSTGGNKKPSKDSGSKNDWVVDWN